MPSAFEELQQKLKQSLDLRVITFASQVADVLRRFEQEEKPVIYDQGKDYHYLHFAEENHPMGRQETLLNMLGFLDNRNKNDNCYDYYYLVLNEKARAMYELLKKEGYYSKQSS